MGVENERFAIYAPGNCYVYDILAQLEQQSTGYFTENFFVQIFSKKLSVHFPIDGIRSIAECESGIFVMFANCVNWKVANNNGKMTESVTLKQKEINDYEVKQVISI